MIPQGPSNDQRESVSSIRIVRASHRVAIAAHAIALANARTGLMRPILAVVLRVVRAAEGDEEEEERDGDE
jgi:hypothetical protein